MLVVKGSQRKHSVNGRYGVIIITKNDTLETPIRSCMGSHKIWKTMGDFIREMAKACRLQPRVKKP